MNFGDILKKTRLEMGLNQVELANKLNISKQTISKYEKGEALPSLNTLKDIADVLNCSADYLMGRVAEKNMAVYSTVYEGKEIKLVMDLKDKEEIIRRNEAKLKELEQVCLNLMIENNKLKNN